EAEAVEAAEGALNLVLMSRYKGLHGVVSGGFGGLGGLRAPYRRQRHLSSPLVAADRPRCANWLAHVERHEPGPQRPAVRAAFSLLKSTNPMSRGTTTVSLYPVGPLEPAGARSLPPQEVARWLVATNDAKLRIIVANSIQWPWSPDRLRDRKAYRELVVMLAEEIYP